MFAEDAKSGTFLAEIFFALNLVTWFLCRAPANAATVGAWGRLGGSASWWEADCYHSQKGWNTWMDRDSDEWDCALVLGAFESDVMLPRSIINLFVPGWGRLGEENMDLGHWTYIMWEFYRDQLCRARDRDPSTMQLLHRPDSSCPVGLLVVLDPQPAVSPESSERRPAENWRNGGASKNLYRHKRYFIFKNSNRTKTI